MLVVIPAAGHGTRLLPITKSIPKEMFPLIDKPVIHHVVEETFLSGIEEIIIVMSERKKIIKDYFQNFEIEDLTKRKEKPKNLKSSKLEYYWEDANVSMLKGKKEMCKIRMRISQRQERYLVISQKLGWERDWRGG